MPKAPEPSSTCQKTTKSLPRISPKSYCYNAVPNRFSSHLSTSPTNAATFVSRGCGGYTLGFRRRIAHRGLHAETGGVSDGGGITTLRAFRTFTNIPGPGIRTAHFAALGAWSGALPKNTESLRNSDALMRVAVPQASRPRWAAQPLLWSSWLSCFCLKPLLQTALRHGTMVSPNRNP